MHKTILAFVAVLIVLFSSPVVAGRYKVIEVKNGASVSGQVTFSGDVPRIILPVTKDTKVCHVTGKEGKPSPRLVVGKEGGVKNTVVFLTKVPKGKPFPKSDPVLDQKSCAFEPHVLLVPQRSKLKIRNSDPVLHNVHAYLRRADVFNLALPTKGQVIEKRLRRAGVVRLKCDAGHTWMSGYVFVMEHPYYAVADEKGQFSLENVPAGKYTLRVWHEGWKRDPRAGYKNIQLDIPLKLEGGEKVDLQFTLKVDGTLSHKKKPLAAAVQQ